MRNLTLFISFFAAISAHAYDPRNFFEDVRSANSVDDLVERLPREMRESYTLQHTPTKGAAQACSAENPRAILANQTGNLVLTFNDHPSLRGYDSVEALTFDARKGSFDLYLVKYAANGTPTVARNPKMCLSCHGAAPHPLWNSYGRWKNFFGSDDEKIDYPAKEEIGALRAFNAKLRSGKISPRYKKLEPRLLGSLDITPYTGTHFDPKTNPLTTDFYFSPNFRIGMFLFRANSLAIAKRMRTHPLWRELLPLSFYAANCSPGEGKTKAEVWASNAKTFVFPDRAEFVAKYPRLEPYYDPARANVTALLRSQDPRLADTQKYFNFFGVSPQRLTLLEQFRGNESLQDLFFDDGLSAHVTQTMAIYPGEMLRDLKSVYPNAAIPFVEGRNEKIYHWTTSPEIMDRLDAITKHALGKECGALWPLIIKNAASPAVTRYLRR